MMQDHCKKPYTINLALNVGSEKIDRDQSKLIKGTNYCHKDDCKDRSNNEKALLLPYFDWPIPVFLVHQVY